jgi:hypothetical protein
MVQAKYGKMRMRAQADWGFANIIAPGTFSDATDLLAAEAFLPELLQEEIRTAAFKARFHADFSQGGSRADSKLPIKIPAHGVDASSPVANPVEHPDGMLFAGLLGAPSINGYDAANLVAGSTSSNIKVTSAAGFRVGQALLIPLVAGGYGVGWIKSINTAPAPDEITLIASLSSAAAAAGTIFGSLTYYESLALEPQRHSVQWIGADGAYVVLWDAVTESLKCARGPKAQPMFEASLITGGWDEPGSTTAPAVFTSPFPELGAAIGRFDPTGGSRLLIGGGDVESIACEWEITQGLHPVGRYSAQEGVGRRIVSERMLTLKVRVPVGDIYADFSEIPDVGSSLGVVQIDYSTIPGAAFSLLIPSARVQKKAALTSDGDVQAFDIELKPGPYTGDGATTFAGGSQWRVAFA